MRLERLSVDQVGRAGFTLILPEATGVKFTNVLSPEKSLTNQIYLNGSGVAVGDVDGDGWCELYFCGLDNRNALYRNLGNWRFEDVADQAGVACEGLDATGAAFADLDGNGHLDLVVNSVGQGTHLFRNDGHGHFSPWLVLNPGRCGTSVAVGDFDGDGWLDLYLANYRTSTMRDQPQTKFRVAMRDGQPVVVKVNDRPATEPDLEGRYQVDLRGSIFEFGEPDALYRNEGGTHFVLVPFTSGAFLDEDGRPLPKPPYDWGLTAAFRDLNGDGWPDLYVCNDFHTPDRIWLNDGHGRFRALPKLALRTTCMNAMGVDFADLDRDGRYEIFASDMYSRFHELRAVQVADVTPTLLGFGRIDDRPQYVRNTLQWNRGDGTYAEIAQFAGLEGSEWTWCPLFLDVDLDGYEDLLVTTGHERDSMNADTMMEIAALKQQQSLTPAEQVKLNRRYPRLPTPNVAFRNRGNLTFEEVGDRWGYQCTAVSQGQALADLDNDGDLDVAVNNLNGVAALYRNESPAPRLAVRLKGMTPNTQGIGARISVTGGPVLQSQEIMAGGRYLSSDAPTRTFAAGSAGGPLTIEVLWRSGRRSVVTNAAPNCRYEIVEPGSPVSPRSLPDRPVPLFEDVSASLGHRHAEEPFDDYARQPLLPRKLSQLGPGLAWGDLNGDGLEDLAVGTGRGGRLAVFWNRGNGRFDRAEDGVWNPVATRDQAGMVGWGVAVGSARLLVAAANYEDGLTSGPGVQSFAVSSNAPVEAIPAALDSFGPLALADYTGDGTLGLFVGGRCLPGRYPQPASSRLYRLLDGHWTPDVTNTLVLKQVGLVSSAVWTDLQGQGWPALVLACDWGALRVFENDHGRLHEATHEWGLDCLSGWWNGVAAGDFDGDGRMDLVGANWGLNHRHRATLEHPRKLYYADFEGFGRIDPLEAGWDERLQREVPDRGLRAFRMALMSIQDRVGTFADFGKATLETIAGEQWKQALVVNAGHLATTVFLNRGRRFEAVPLPAEAQWAPAFGVVVADFDGDGHEDCFLAQNFFGVHPEDWRQDAGRGLLLRGLGDGRLTPVAGQASGILIYGEQRGAAAADYDADGRTDLAVAQNANATGLFHNRTANQGLRVRLAGSSGNPGAVGAVLRLKAGGALGPAREIHAGAGYWSQDGAVQVMGGGLAAEALWVRWPGGRQTEVDLPAGAQEIEVSADGRLRRLR